MINAIHGILASKYYDAATIAYRDRVEADGGTIKDLAYVNSVIRLLILEGVYSNLASWVSANAGVKKDGSNFVSKMYCITGKDMLQATGSAQPTWVSSGKNGRAIMQFNGSQFLKATTNIGISGTAERQVIAVARQTTNSAVRNLMGWGGETVNGTANDLLMFSSSAVIAWHGYGTGYDNRTSAPTLAFNEWFWTHNNVKAGVVKSAKNNSSTYSFTLSSAINTTNTPLAFGAGAWSGANSFYGDAMEAMVFNIELPSTTLAKINALQNTYYNLYT